LNADENENRLEVIALTSRFPVELPGIEPVAKMALICGDTHFNDATVRETTRNDLRIREWC
jgi:hypothetical protein